MHTDVYVMKIYICIYAFISVSSYSRCLSSVTSFYSELWFLVLSGIAVF